MLLVRTMLAPSPIEGTGCFAAEPIAKGQPIWRFVPGFDEWLDPEIAGIRYNPEYLERYAQQCPLTKCWVLCRDGAQYINHSDAPNMGQQAPLWHPAYTHDALRDIAAGEEITCDYRIGDAQPFSGFGEREQASRSHACDTEQVAA